MRRFRPNIVLDGIDAHDEDHIDSSCTSRPSEGPVRAEAGQALRALHDSRRRSRPAPNTGTRSRDTLAGYRADPRMDGGVTFGMNAIVVEGVSALLRVGQRGHASFAF